MRVGELSRRSGVSVASIKYYLREGMLAPGERTGPNQALYGENHLRRLRLIRALLDVGGLSVAAARRVLDAVDDGERPLHDVLGTVQGAVVPASDPVEVDDPAETDDAATAGARTQVDELLARRGWRVHPGNAGRAAAVDVLATFARLEHDELAGTLEVYAEAMERVARAEVGLVVDRGDREATVEAVVTGTVLGARLLSAVRTMAQEDASTRRLG